MYVSATNYNIIMKKLSREKRREVYEQFNKVRDQYASISASLLNNYVKTKNNLSQIYKFNSAWEQKLFSLKLTVPSEPSLNLIFKVFFSVSTTTAFLYPKSFK